MTTRARAVTAADLAQHDMLDGFDEHHIVAALRAAEPALTGALSHDVLASLANATLLAVRFQGFTTVSCGSVIGPKADLATRWDR